MESLTSGQVTELRMQMQSKIHDAVTEFINRTGYIPDIDISVIKHGVIDLPRPISYTVDVNVRSFRL